VMTATNGILLTTSAVTTSLLKVCPSSPKNSMRTLPSGNGSKSKPVATLVGLSNSASFLFIRAAPLKQPGHIFRWPITSSWTVAFDSVERSGIVSERGDGLKVGLTFAPMFSGSNGLVAIAPPPGITNLLVVDVPLRVLLVPLVGDVFPTHFSVTSLCEVGDVLGGVLATRLLWWLPAVERADPLSKFT